MVEGDCGPAGIIVLEPNSSSGRFAVHDPAPLGLAGASDLQGQVSGDTCPIDLTSPSWAITATVCGDVAGARDGGLPGEAPPPADARTVVVSGTDAATAEDAATADARTVVLSGTDAASDARTVVVSGTDARTVVVSGTDGPPAANPGGLSCGTRRCVPARVGDELQLTCTNGGIEVCRARLRRLP
jgi:hypothetical protein